MGLQSHLNYASADSIPVMFLCLFAASVSSIRSFVVSLMTRAAEPSTRLDGLRDASSLGDDVDCVVCRYGIVKGETVTELPCRHVFHRECLRGWLRSLHFSCPLCRFQLVEA